MDNTQKPSLDWQKRIDPLNGDEHLLRQNPESDSSSDPKEERIPVDLISDYVISQLNISETVTILSLSGSNLIYRNERGEDILIDLSGIIGDENRARITSGVYNPNTTLLTLSRDDNSSIIIDLSTINSSLVSVNTGNIIGTYTDQTGLQVQIEETITSMVLNGTTLRYFDEQGNNTDIDLSNLISQSRIIQGNYNSINKILTLTRDDNTFIDIPLSNVVQTTSSITNTVIGNLIATHNDGGEISTDIFETITNLTLNGVNLTYVNEEGVSVEYDLTDLSEDINLSRIVSGSISGNILTLVRDDNSIITINLGDFGPTISSVENVNGGKTIAVHDNGLGDLTSIEESITTLSLSNQTLSYVNETGNTTNIDLSTLLDDTNLSRIISGEIVSTNLVLTRDDESTITIALDEILDGAISEVTDTINGHQIAIHGDGNGNTTIINETITDLTFADNVLTYTREDGSIANIDLSEIANQEFRPRISNVTYSPITNVLTLTRDDQSTLSTDLGSLVNTDAVSSMQILISGSPIANHLNGQGVTETIFESITSIVQNSGGTYTYINELGVQSEIELNETLTSFFYSGDTISYTDENENTVSYVIPNNISLFTNTLSSGNLIGTHDDGESNTTDLFESITQMNLNGNNLIYTKEGGDEDIIDLSPFLGTNLPRIISGQTTDTSLILERDDESLVIIDLSLLNSTVTDLVAGSPIATHTANNVISVINESITSLSLNGTTLTYDKEGTGEDVIDLSELNRPRIVSGSFNSNDNTITLTRDDSSTVIIDISDFSTNPSSVTGTQAGNTIAIHNDGEGNEVNINETITNMVLNDNTLVYTKEDGTINNIDLSAYVGTNLPRIVSGSISGNILTLVRDDSTSINIDINTLVSTINNTIAGNTIAEHIAGGTQTNINETITSIELLGTNLEYSKEGGGLDVVDLSSLTGTSSIVTATNTGKEIAVHDDGDGNLTSIQESVTSISITDSTINYIDENANTTPIDLTSFENRPRVISGIYDTGVLTLTRDDSSSFTVNIPEGAVSAFTDLITGHLIGRHDDGDGNIVDLFETITTISLNGTDLIYVDENGDSQTLDLSSLSEDTNLSRIVSGSVNTVDDTLTLVRDDNSTIVIDLNGFAPTTSSITNTITGNRIATHDNGLSAVVDINESVTTLVDGNDGTYTYTSENNTTTVIDTNETVTTIVDNGGSFTYTNEANQQVTISYDETLTTLVDNGSSFTYTSEDGTITTITYLNSTVIDNGDGTTTITGDDGNSVTLSNSNITITPIVTNGHTIAIYNSNPSVNIQETITNLSLSGTNLLYTDEGGVENIISLAQFENLDRIISGEFDGEILTLTRSDNSFIEIPFTNLFPVSSVDQTQIGNRIARHTNGNGQITDINESFTSLSLVNNLLTYDKEGPLNDTIDLSYLDSNASVVTDNNPSGLIIATHNDGDGNEVTIKESLTSLIRTDINVLTYTDENGDSFNLDVLTETSPRPRIDEISLLQSSTHILTLTREDGSTLSQDISQVVSNLIDVLPNGHRIFRYRRSAQNGLIDVYETVTSIALNGNILTYTDENGNDTNLTISGTGGGATSIITGALPTGNAIATHDDGNGNTTVLNETITSISLNGSILTYTDESGINTDLTLPSGSGGTPSSVTGTQVGNTIAVHNNGEGNIVDINETVTAVIDNGNGTFDYIDETGTTFTVDTNVGGGGGGNGLFDSSNEGATVAISSAVINNNFSFDGDGSSDFNIDSFGSINIVRSPGRRLEITGSLTRLQSAPTTLTLDGNGVNITNLPNYQTTADAAADTSLPVFNLFRVSNNDGTSDVHIKTSS